MTPREHAEKICAYAGIALNGVLYKLIEDQIREAMTDARQATLTDENDSDCACSSCRC
jgi:hypothetical protein